MTDDVAVIGVGIHPFGRHEGVTGLQMAAIAARPRCGRRRRLGGRRFRRRRPEPRAATPTRGQRSSG